MKKFELTEECATSFSGTKLFRIKALMEFGDVKAGDLGGFVEKEENLDQEGNAWVYDDSKVYGNDSVVTNNSVVDNSVVDNSAVGNSVVDNSRVDNSVVTNSAIDNGHIQHTADCATVGGFGSEHRTTTFFRTKDKNIGVGCGCFYGTLAEFREKVKETHGDSKTAKEYLMIADLMEFKFAEEVSE